MKHSRRLQREMSRARQILNRDPLPAVPEQRPTPPRPLPNRIEHPAIEPTHGGGWFKVYRLERGPVGEFPRLSGPFVRVCIGEFPTLSSAIVHAENELYRAQVRDWQDMPRHDTWRAEKKL